MSSTLTPLQELALDLVAEQHASVESMEDEVKVLFGNGVSRQQVTGALATLRDAGLVDAFVYREAEGDYQRYRRPRLKAGAKLWWYATDLGRSLLAEP